MLCLDDVVDHARYFSAGSECDRVAAVLRARLQVSLTLAAVGKPGIETNDALGYELGEDALKFLRAVAPPTGEDGACSPLNT